MSKYNGEEDIVQRLYRPEQIKDKRDNVEVLQQDKLRIELEQCSFYPQTNKVSGAGAQNFIIEIDSHELSNRLLLFLFLIMAAYNKSFFLKMILPEPYLRA